MSKKITSLTDEQIAKFPEYVDKWTRIGLSCEPCDVETSKRAVCLVYQAAGLNAPALWLVMDSPISAAIAATIVRTQVRTQVGDQVWAQVRAQVGAQVWTQVRAQVRAQVGAQVWTQVGAQVWTQVRAQVRAQVWAQVKDQVRTQVRTQVRAQVWAQVKDQVGAQVRDQVGAQVKDQVWAQVGAQVWAQVGAQVGAQVRDQVYGSHDAGWLSFYDFMYRELNLEVCNRLTGSMTLAEHCGWWSPYSTLVILQHRHCELHRADGRLHNERGPAVLYRDGFAVWSLRGVRVDEQIVIRPETQTPEQIRGEKNAEVKRVRIERYGWQKYLTEIHALVVDQRRNDIEQTNEVLLQADGMTVLLCACPSTGRIYGLEVPDEIEKCEQAQRWLSGDLTKNLVGAS